MPKQERPVTHRPKIEDESTGNGSERHGKHREEDEALPGKGSSVGGLNKYAARSDEQQTSGGGRARKEHGKRNPKSRAPGSTQRTND